MSMEFLERMRVMTSRNRDWIDEVLEDEECTVVQMGIIESLLVTSAANYLYQNINLNELTYNEAEEIIKVLYENNCPTDTREQYKYMFKRGVFD